MEGPQVLNEMLPKLGNQLEDIAKSAPKDTDVDSNIDADHRSISAELSAHIDEAPSTPITPTLESEQLCGKASSETAPEDMDMDSDMDSGVGSQPLSGKVSAHIDEAAPSSTIREPEPLDGGPLDGGHGERRDGETSELDDRSDGVGKNTSADGGDSDKGGEEGAQDDEKDGPSGQNHLDGVGKKDVTTNNDGDSDKGGEEGAQNNEEGGLGDQNRLDGVGKKDTSANGDGEEEINREKTEDEEMVDREKTEEEEYNPRGRKRRHITKLAEPNKRPKSSRLIRSTSPSRREDLMVNVKSYVQERKGAIVDQLQGVLDVTPLTADAIFEVLRQGLFVPNAPKPVEPMPYTENLNFEVCILPSHSALAPSDYHPTEEDTRRTGVHRGLLWERSPTGALDSRSFLGGG